MELACQKCKDDGKATDCKHMLHLVPSWQSSEKHIRLKKVMEDRPDLIASELSGLAFDSLQQCFRKVDVERMLYDLQPPIPIIYEEVYIFVDPAAGGPGSDYGVMSVTRNRGMLVVSACLSRTGCILLLQCPSDKGFFHEGMYSSFTICTRSLGSSLSSWSHILTMLSWSTGKNRLAFSASTALAPIIRQAWSLLR